MKIILGDNQFFGGNHFDLKIGEKTKNKFDDTSKIEEFIKKSETIFYKKEILIIIIKVERFM